MACNVKPQGDNCIGKANIIPGCIDRNWHDGSEIAILVIGGIRESSAEELHSSWDFWAHCRKNRTAKQTKNQLRNYCVKENYNSERIMWRNRFYNTAEGTGTYSSAAVSENTCTAWPRVVCKSCLVSPVLNWCCCSVPMH